MVVFLLLLLLLLLLLMMMMMMHPLQHSLLQDSSLSVTMHPSTLSLL
jgi:hypothetical protein